MELKISEIVAIWNLLNKIYQLNETFSGSWDAYMAGNFKILKPITDQLSQKSSEQRKEIQDTVVSLPLFQISVEDLPKNVPPGTTEVLKTLLYDYKQAESEFDLDELIEMAKNGKPQEHV